MLLYKPIMASLLLSTCIRTQAHAQQLLPQAIGAAGQSYTSNNLLLESNVGELVVTDISTMKFMYTPGFLQPEAGTTASIPEINNVVLNSGSGTDNAGASFKTGNAGIDFTVGEWVSLTHSNSSHIITQGILQPYQLETILPVTGLTFTARRINPGLVQLNWKTSQEINNTGFHIERKDAHENAFRAISYIPTKAMDGNSFFPLEYSTTDANSYTGQSWYRIRQQDRDGHQSYSAIRIVAGNTGKMESLKAWPVPAIGHFTVMAEGIEQDVLQVFDIKGNLVQQWPIQNGVGRTIYHLPAGTYILRLANNKELLVKAVVQ